MKYFKEYLHFSFYLFVPSLVLLITQNLGVFVFLRYYNEDLLGVYYIITHLFAIIVLIWKSVGQILIPSYSKLIKEKNFTTLRLQLHKIEKYFLILSSFLIISTFISAFKVIEIFLGEYYAENGINFLYLLIIGTFSWGFYGPFSSLLISSENLKILLFNRIFSLILSILCWIVLIPIMGIIALKLGEIVSSFFIAIFTRIFLFKKYTIGEFKIKNLVLIILEIIILTIVYFLKPLIPNDFFYIIGFNLIILVIFFILITVTKIIDKNDVLYIIDIINIKKMIDYIKEETTNNEMEESNS